MQHWYNSPHAEIKIQQPAFPKQQQTTRFWMDEENSSPLCSLVESNDGNDYSTARKRLRKKGNVAAERSDTNNVGVGVCLTHSEKKSRRGRRHREDVQEIEQRVSTPQKKKQKKNKSVTDSSYLSSLPRTSTAEKFGQDTRGRNTVDGAVVSGLGSGVCLTHTKSSMKNRSNFDVQKTSPKTEREWRIIVQRKCQWRVSTKAYVQQQPRPHWPKCSYERIHSYIHDYFTLLFSTLLYSTLLYSTLPYPTLPYPTPPHPTPPHPTPPHPTPPHPTPPHPTPPHPTPPHPTPPHPTPPHPTLPYPTYPTPLHSTLLYSTLLYFTLLYFTLLFSRRCQFGR